MALNALYLFDGKVCEGVVKNGRACILHPHEDGGLLSLQWECRNGGVRVCWQMPVKNFSGEMLQHRTGKILVTLLFKENE